MNAPSSSGKSYIPLEIANLFPNEDVIKIGNCSPTAFFHEQGQYDKETNTTTVDLSKKILIFLDMPHTGLLEKLRSFLSHDEKIMISKITDKGQKGGNKTKTVILKGYPSVIFCSAGFNIDEQEQTRFLILSPESTKEKIEQGINQAIKKAVDPEGHEKFINSDPRRNLLKERILDIKNMQIGDIRVSSEETVRELFMANTNGLKPRHQRDIKRFISLIKSVALLNCWWREKTESGIIANESDIQEAFKIWEKISVSQEMNISPYVYSIYKEVIIPLWKEKEEKNKTLTYYEGEVLDCGITRKEILQKYYDNYKRPLDVYKLRQDILKSLETAGLITQEQDPNNRRQSLVLPAIETEEYSVDDSGVINDIPLQIKTGNI